MNKCDCVYRQPKTNVIWNEAQLTMTENEYETASSEQSNSSTTEKLSYDQVMNNSFEKMTGSKTETCSSRAPTDSVAVAKKIIVHSKADPCGAKFLKYLQYASVVKRGSSSSSSGSAGFSLKELRNCGALEAIMIALQKVFTCPQVASLSGSMVPTKPDSLSTDVRGGHAKEICKTALSILSNAFALDYSVRAQAVNNGFASSLQQFIASFTQNGSGTIIIKNADILRRAVKCTANLANDSSCRDPVLKTGVAISILKILELVDEVVSKNESSSESGESFLDKSSNNELICSCVRAIRILASDPKFSSSGRDHLLKFGAFVSVLNVLTWDAKLSSNEDLVLDVIRALTLLSIKIKSAPAEVIQGLTDHPETSKIRHLVRIFEGAELDGKLFTPVINCLINLSSSKEISDCLGGLRIFHIILDKLEKSDESYYNGMIKLLIALTRCSSFNQSHLATSSLIGSTLKILKSWQFKEFHDWLLMVYEKLYEGSLSKLISCGLVNHLCEILREELEECDYDCLRKKITTLDNGRCSVHQLQEDGVCPFAPVYRCNSPSYQEIQEAMKNIGSRFEDNYEYPQTKGDDSLSPFSSPAHSWSSGGSSPFHSGASHASYSSFSEDEGCYSPTPVCKEKRSRSSSEQVILNQERSDVEILSSGLSDMDGDSDEHGPALKKLKLEDGSSSSLSDNNSTLKRQHSDKSLDALKTSVKKIVSVLTILYKCTHINPFPVSILPITPILLGIIVRGKVSLMPQRVEYQNVQSDDEFRDLSRKTFEVSYKIILKMCSSIKIFPEMIVSGFVPVLHRLQEPGSSKDVKMDKQVEIIQEYCANLITRMVGVENETAGWREGFIMSTLLVNNSSISNNEMNQTILNIPLLYEKYPITLRKFEMKAKSWTKILEMLVNSDETSFYRFEDCALALCSICNAIGVEWRAHDADAKVPTLFNISLETRDSSSVFKIIAAADDCNIPINDELEVKLSLDDGSTLLVKKDLLVKSSPVFSAMFDGHFMEAGEQKVHLPNVSSTAVCLLLDQIYMMTISTPVDSQESKYQNQYELGTIFELFSLADRYLLDDIYERALNTLITSYICPHSAPLIYAESVKLVNLQRSNNHRQMLGDSGLNLFILKYILTAKGLRMSERCSAIRKVFDSVMPEHVVRDLKSLIERYMYKTK